MGYQTDHDRDLEDVRKKISNAQRKAAKANREKMKEYDKARRDAFFKKAHEKTPSLKDQKKEVQEQQQNAYEPPSFK